MDQVSLDQSQLVRADSLRQVLDPVPVVEQLVGIDSDDLPHVHGILAVVHANEEVDGELVSTEEDAIDVRATAAGDAAARPSASSPDPSFG